MAFVNTTATGLTPRFDLAMKIGAAVLIVVAAMLTLLAAEVYAGAQQPDTESSAWLNSR